MPSVNILGLPDQFVFQQDNDPKHTSRIAKKYFEENEIELLDWPAQSPDINQLKIYGTIWMTKIVVVTCKLVERYLQVIDAQGLLTKY